MVGNGGGIHGTIRAFNINQYTHQEMLMKNECRRAQPLTVPTTPTRRTTAFALLRPVHSSIGRAARAVLLPPNTLCLRTGPAGPGPCVLKRG